MFIQNVLYSTIDLYIKKINQYLDESYLICGYCKTYDKNKDDIVIFKCFDIKSYVKTESDFIISQIEYSGYLEFTYNKTTNEVYVSKLPYIVEGKVEVSIFTNDVAQIIVDKVKSYIPKEDIKLTFSNPLTVFAIDSSVKNTIPSFADTRNFNIINHIIDTINLEERRIRQHILSLKAQKDREDRAIEKAVSKKRKIYGIDPNDYENQQEFYRVMDQKICEVYSRKIEKIRRHLHLNEQKYKEMLKRGILSINSDILNFICLNMDFRNWSKKNGISIDKFNGIYHQNSFFGDYYFYDEEVDVEQITKDIQPVIDKYIEDRYYYDLHDPRGILALVDFVKKEVMTLPELREPGEPRINNDTLYTWVVTQLAAIAGNGDTNGWVNGEYDYTEEHPIFGNHNYSYTKTRPSQRWNDGWIYTYKFSHDIGKAIELLLQIRALTNQLQYYRSILDEPSKALLTFKKNNNSWNAIMQYPYFLRMGRDPYVNGGYELFNLLMIKPGTLIFNDANIRYFIQKGDKEKQVSTSCHRMIVAIPDSLEHHSMLKVIEYAYDRGENLNIICQSPDLASRVKSILVVNELNARRNNSKYIKGNYFINIDPNYYNAFFVDTPDNKEFWHRYDYSSDYKYRRKIIYDLNAIIDMCIQEYSQEHSDSTEINNDILLEMILGSYSCGDDSFNLNEFLLNNQGIDGRYLPDDCDKVLAFMQIEPQLWKKELPLIDNFKWKIDNYLKCYYEDFLRKKEEMLVFKELFPNYWQEMWTKRYLSTPASKSLLDTIDVKNMIEALNIFKSLFPDDWEDMWIKINMDKVFCGALIQVYRKEPQITKDNILIRKRERNWQDTVKVWLLNVYEDESLPF